MPPLIPVIPAKAVIQAVMHYEGRARANGPATGLDPGLRRDDGFRGVRLTRTRPTVDDEFAQRHCEPHFPPGCVTVSTAGVTLPTPRRSGRYMSSTSDGGTVYVPGVTARTR